MNPATNTLLLILVALLLAWILWRWYMYRQWVVEVSGMLRAWREQKGITQKEAARRISEYLGRYVSTKDYERWESGRIVPLPMTALQMKNFLQSESAPAPQWLAVRVEPDDPEAGMDLLDEFHSDMNVAKRKEVKQQLRDQQVREQQLKDQKIREQQYKNQIRRNRRRR